MCPTSAREREQHYRFLASLYLRPPSDALLGMIGGGSIPPALELEAEHTALFVLPSGVIPHEAFYLDTEKRLGGSVTIAVEQFYRRAGINILGRCIEMPDHLGVELEFMAVLCKLEGDLEEAGETVAVRRCLEFQRTFLEEHLSRWAPECCESVIRHARYGLYKAIARFTMEFLKSEQARLRVRHPQGARPCEPAQST